MKLLMSNNKFKLYCILFCEENNGNTFGEVIPDIIDEVKNTIINFKDFQFQEYTISKTLYLENLDYSIIFNNRSGYLTRRNGMMEYSYNFPSLKRTEDIV